VKEGTNIRSGLGFPDEKPLQVGESLQKGVEVTGMVTAVQLLQRRSLKVMEDAGPRYGETAELWQQDGGASGGDMHASSEAQHTIDEIRCGTKNMDVISPRVACTIS
jgi:hypothetical protein